jgi:hypothetical protein
MDIFINEPAFRGVMQLGKCTVMLNPVHSNEPAPMTELGRQHLEHDLDRLAALLEDTPGWVLRGGLAIPLTTGVFYRQHRDIDLGIHQDDVPVFEEVLRRQSYGLFSRTLMAKISRSRKLDVYQKISCDDAKHSSQHIRAVRLDRAGRIVQHQHILFGDARRRARRRFRAVRGTLRPEPPGRRQRHHAAGID